ncbi:MAG TPA: hypothetical protein VIJ38_15790 [Acidobacteriaceae bacterium]
MPDVVIENAIRTLKQRRDEIDAIIKSLERVAGGAARGVQPTSTNKKEPARKGKPMSAASKAKLRAAYATNHPGWKPKKK